MRARLASAWDNALDSLWFIPAVLVLAAVVLSSALLYVDDALAPDVGARVELLFGGTAGAACGLLSTIAGSLITVISVAFSITLVALQQASSQYSPRVLRNFTKDRGNQVVLGTYLATFVYALLVMRQIREATGDQAEVVPALSITMAVALALVSIGMLVYYIDHISGSLQVSNILAAIGDELRVEIDNLFPSRFGRGSQEPPDVATLLARLTEGRRGYEAVVRSEGAGYLRRIDYGQLEKSTPGGTHLAWVAPYVGEYIHPRGELARLWSSGPLDDESLAGMRGCFVLDKSRTIHQDPLFGITQLVDIAVKALSPGVNDPTTAEQSLSALGDAVSQLAGREFPSPLRLSDAGTPYLFSRPSFSDFVDASFSQIRRAAKDDVHVTLHLLGILEEVAWRVPGPERAAPLRVQVEEVLAALQSVGFTAYDQQQIRHKAGRALAALRQARDRSDRAV